jgi:hypothetical protein
MVLRFSSIVQGLVIHVGLATWVARFRLGSFGLPVEAMKRRTEIVEHGRKITVQGGTTAD